MAKAITVYMFGLTAFATIGSVNNILTDKALAAVFAAAIASADFFLGVWCIQHIWSM